MVEDINLSETSLTALSYKSRSVLSALLNPQKLFPSEQDKLPRDWRGLAALVNIPLELESLIKSCEDKTAKLLEIWTQRRDSTATVGLLLTYLQKLDRYDVVEDLNELATQQLLIGSTSTQHAEPTQQVSLLEEVRDDLMTIDDVKFGKPQWYHAYVLYAKEDEKFVDELLQRMSSQGFKLCTEKDLLPGFTTQYAPISRLISERCYRIILIYSPDFLESPAIGFYMDYAQAVGIQSKRPKIIPCMYRPCQLPTHLTFYHMLYYKNASIRYDFWSQLARALTVAPLPRATTATSTALAQIADSKIANGQVSSSVHLDSVLQTHKKSFSINDLNKVHADIDDGRVLSDLNPISVRPKQKRSNKIKKFFTQTFGGKKHKERPIMVENS